MVELSESYSTVLGFDDLPDENAIDKVSRSQMIDFMCRMKSQECLSQMLNKLKFHVNDIEALAVNSEASVFCYGLMASALANEGPQLFEKMWRKMQASGNTEYRLRIINSLGCYGDRKVLFDLLETILGSTSEARYFRAENFEIIQSVFSATLEGVEATIDFMIEFQSDAVRRSQRSDLVAVLLENLPSRIVDENVFEKVNLNAF